MLVVWMVGGRIYKAKVQFIKQFLRQSGHGGLPYPWAEPIMMVSKFYKILSLSGQQNSQHSATATLLLEALQLLGLPKDKTTSDRYGYIIKETYTAQQQQL